MIGISSSLNKVTPIPKYLAASSLERQRTTGKGKSLSFMFIHRQRRDDKRQS